MSLLSTLRRWIGLTDEQKFETHWGSDLQEDVYAVGGRRPKMPKMPSQIADHTPNLVVPLPPDVTRDGKLKLPRPENPHL